MPTFANQYGDVQGFEGTANALAAMMYQYPMLRRQQAMEQARLMMEAAQLQNQQRIGESTIALHKAQAAQYPARAAAWQAEATERGAKADQLLETIRNALAGGAATRRGMMAATPPVGPVAPTGFNPPNPVFNMPSITPPASDVAPTMGNAARWNAADRGAADVTSALLVGQPQRAAEAETIKQANTALTSPTVLQALSMLSKKLPTMDLRPGGMAVDLSAPVGQNVLATSPRDLAPFHSLVPNVAGQTGLEKQPPGKDILASILGPLLTYQEKTGDVPPEVLEAAFTRGLNELKAGRGQPSGQDIQPGTIYKGYKYLGGDKSNPSSWEKVQ